jgi:hypothetical protein
MSVDKKKEDKHKIVCEQHTSNGSVHLNDIHNKFKNLVIPAGLALFDPNDMVHIHTKNIHCYDVNHKNEHIHDSLYDRLVELASYNEDDDTYNKDNSKMKKNEYDVEEDDAEEYDAEEDSDESRSEDEEDKKSNKLKVQPVSPPESIKIETEKLKSQANTNKASANKKLTKKKTKSNKKQTKKNKKKAEL